MKVGRHVEGRSIVAPVAVRGALTGQDVPEELAFRRDDKHSTRTGGPDDPILVHLHSIGRPRILPRQRGTVEKHLLRAEGSIRPDVPGEDVISQPTGKVSPSAKNIILISTLLGIIFYTNIFPLLQDIMNVDLATRNASMVPEQRLYTKYEHPDDVSENIRLIKNYLFKGDENNNLEAFNLTEELIIDDSTKADYYAYRGWVYFQRYDLNQEKPENLLLESEKDFIRAIDLKHNLNKDAAVITYLHLASIYLIEDNISDAYSMIKRAMRIDKKYPDVKKKLKEINKRKIQGLERSS